MNPFIYFLNPKFIYLFIAFCSFIFIRTHKDDKSYGLIDYWIKQVVSMLMALAWPAYLTVRAMFIPSFVRLYLLTKATRK